jgi:tetratricopeptide (TPR) repeat protein
MGRTEEGLDHARRAVALDPLSVENAASLGWQLYFARRYDETVVKLRKCIDLNSRAGYAYGILGQVYARQGRFADAIATERTARELDLGNLLPLAELARDYTFAGRAAEARQALTGLLASAKSQYVSKAMMAGVYAAMGDKDQAMAQLEQAY